MNDNIFEAIKIIGFDNESEGYRNVIKVLLTAISETISKASILYDFDSLIGRIKDLKLVKRDYETHEYVLSENTLYLSTCNLQHRKYSDEEMIIFLAHELMHFIALPEDEFFKTYTGFDEFFTEYLAFSTISKVGGIKLEQYYRENVKGYFGTPDDINFIKSLCRKSSFKDLLNFYVNRNIKGIKELLGDETLTSMNDYFHYCDDLTDEVGKPLPKFIDEPIYASQKQIIDSHVTKINISIDEYDPVRYSK